MAHPQELYFHTPEGRPTGLIWLVSYPKSGNTWVRAFLSAYLQGEVDVNKLYGTPIASARMMLDRNLNTKTAELADDQVESLRPQAYVNLAARFARQNRPGIVKVHDRFKMTEAGQPLFPLQVTKATILIVRNPLDVAVSMAHHLGVSLEKSADWICNEKFQLLSEGEGRKSQVRQLIGGWGEHTQSWLDLRNYRVHLVKYEDMHKAPVQTFGGILSAMGFPNDAVKVAAAVHACRMPALQAQELRRAFKEKSPKATAPFFRHGMIGEGEAELNSGLIDKIRNYNGEMMRRLAYLP